jgi:type 1 fimbria pilin
VAGPFDLGYVVVRSAIQIHDDGSVTTTTEPFPSILQGIPLQLRDVRVNLDRPHFMLNPTSCAPMAITGSVVSAENQTAALSSRFQVGECASLAFRPHFSASTQSNGTAGGHGASLDVKIATHQGPDPTTGVASEANIHKVDVQLPEALSSRLTTLNKACTEKQFAINVAGCPSASNVGMAVAHTPLLNVPLSGPAYLVSHGGAAFPDLVLVLQGEGVEIVLTGNTQIKKGITYSKFETAPDAPISSFELKLPEGKFSILGAIKNLCKPTKTVKVKKKGKKVSKLVPEALIMPTSITAQSGAVLTQSTKIAVTGCKKAKAKKAAKKKKKKK